MNITPAASGRKASSAPQYEEPMTAYVVEAARMLKALSHETRLLILCHLLGQELTVSEINARVAGSQSVISQHLAVLRRDRLVKTRRQAQTIYYSLDDEKASRIVEVLHDLYCGEGRA